MRTDGVGAVLDQPQQAARLAQGRAARSLHLGDGRRRRRRVRVDEIGRDGRLDDHHAQRLREDVVQFACDAPALRGGAALGLGRLLNAGPRRHRRELRLRSRVLRECDADRPRSEGESDEEQRVPRQLIAVAGIDGDQHR